MQTADCRLLIDPPAAGVWNMAVDEALLEWSSAGGGCCWRFYRWEEPTLSLGYFQSLDDRRLHPASADCPVVRRASGGGAIVHDIELTYSFVVPAAHWLAARRSFMYEAVHNTLLEVLSGLGVQGELFKQPEDSADAVAQPLVSPASRGAGSRADCGDRREPALGCGADASDGLPSNRRAANPFLCFERRSPGDVVVDDVKVAGSAQRRPSSAVLQHGSVLLSRSAAAPELAGLSDLAGKSIEVEHLVEPWLKALAGRLQLDWCTGPLTVAEKRRAAELAEQKYGSMSWTQYRGRR